MARRKRAKRPLTQHQRNFGRAAKACERALSNGGFSFKAMGRCMKAQLKK